MSVSFVLVLIGVILMVISSFYATPGPPRRPISLWNLSWAFVVAGVFLFGGVKLTE